MEFRDLGTVKMSSSSISAIYLFLFLSFASSALATVYFKTNFTFVNAGEFSEHQFEYGARARYVFLVDGFFQLYFYTTAPNAYTLALRLMLGPAGVWVWEANRGNPVGERAVFALLPNGNMVLADADGRVVWQTKTANKGVAGIDVLPNGNMVLYDSKRNYLWQSFDYPTDTLVIDQYLNLRGPSKLVSRASPELNADGPYSLMIEPTGLSMYYSSPLDRYKYFSSSKWFTVKNPPSKQVTLSSKLATNNPSSYEVSLNYGEAKVVLAILSTNPTRGTSYLRLEMDGNLKFYVLDQSASSPTWETVFTLFSKESRWASECELPSKCGGYGLCQDNQCIACPSGRLNSPTGSLLAWNMNCTPQELKSCAAKDFYYYQLAGVEHFSMQYSHGQGPMTQRACSDKCTNNCKCKAFFYHPDKQKCWTVSDLKTLISVMNKGHVASVKAPK